MLIEKRLEELGLALPEKPEGGGLYSQIKICDGLVFIAGCGPTLDGIKKYRGRVGRELTLEEGREAARDCMLNILASARDSIGDLDSIQDFLKMTVYVACEPDFQDSPKVANGATELLIQLFGDREILPVRTAVGVNSLTDGFPVEIDVILSIRK